MKLTQYERRQIREIKSWKAEEPSIVSAAFGVLFSPATWLLSKLIPIAAIRGALDFSSSIAEWLTDTQDLVRDAGVNSIADLRSLSLETSDALADSVHNWAIGFATTEGAATGAGGAFGIAADIPAIITIALRTIHKIGACYGFEVQTKTDRDFVLAILATSSSNDMKEKVAALLLLRSIEASIMKQTWKGMAQQAGRQTLGREAGIIAVKTLAAQLGINLTKRKALQAIPAIGAIVGASVNGWYIKEVGWAARRMYQERWLAEGGRLAEPIEA